MTKKINKIEVVETLETIIETMNVHNLKLEKLL